MSKLNLDRDRVAECRFLAQKIANHIQDFVQRHTTTSIERATLRLLGINDSHRGRPLANLLVESLTPQQLSKGISHWFGRALAAHRTHPLALAIKIAEGKIRWESLPDVDTEALRRALDPLTRQAIRQLESAAAKRRHQFNEGPAVVAEPLKYVIVATGNIHEDVAQARAAVLGGADCIAVIRSTAQSLLDYVPHGSELEGFGGTYATQENFRIMRQAMDEVGRKVRRHIRVVNYSSGLCMPEIAVLGALEGLDYLLNDCMYGILFRDINMKRTFCDQFFSRLIIARAGIVINTGEDNYLTTAEAFRAFPQVLASHFINEQLAKTAHLRDEQIGLGHAFEIDPLMEDSLLYEIAHAEMVREIFPHCPIKYMPPTRHMTGDLYFGHVLDTLFNLVGVMTHQSIQLLGMPTEGIHNPLLQDRAMSLKGAHYLFQAARSLGDEISWSPNGKIIRRARSVLEDSFKLLQKVERIGITKSIEEGAFANIRRSVEGGIGLDGVLKKEASYWNPFLKLLDRDAEIGEEARPQHRSDHPRSGHGPGHDRGRRRNQRHRPHRTSHARGGGGAASERKEGGGGET